MVRNVTLQDIAVLVTLAAIAIALRRRLIPPRWSDRLAFSIAALISCNVFGTVLVQGSPSYLIFVPLVVIGMGLFVLSGRLLVVTVGLNAAAWVCVAPTVTSGDGLQVSGYTLLVGAILAASVYTARARSRRRIERLREADVETKRALQEALTAAERELVDRKRAEEARIALEEQLAHSQRLESIGSLAGGVAHDINNVLGGISAIASLIRDTEALQPDTVTDIEEVLAACRRGQALTRNLLAFARKGEHRTERFCPNDTVREVERLLTRIIPKMIVVETQLEESLAEVIGDPGQLCQAVMNLCINSVDAMGEGGRLVITTENASASELASPVGARVGRSVLLRVRDTGTGMDEETRKQAFDPFYTTKGTGEGTGLGLSMVYGTVTRLGGVVEIESEPGEGTTITIGLPALESVAAPEVSDDKDDLSSRPGGETVLVVDDEQLIRNTSKRILERRGYRVLLAENGAAAVEAFEARWQEIALVILDMSMPVLDGRSCYFQLREIKPSVRVLISSGYARGEAAEELLREGALGELSKPFDAQQLERAVARAIGSRDAGVAPSP